MTQQIQLAQVAENVYEIPQSDDMRVPVRVYGSDALLEEMQTEGDLTLTQILDAIDAYNSGNSIE